MPHLHLAVAQVHSRAGAVAGNLARVERQAQAAALNGCDLVLFAETVLHAYVFTPANLALAEVAGAGPATCGVIALAVRHRITIAAGFLERSATGIHNSHLVAFPDGTWTVRRKTELTETERKAGLIAGDGSFEPVVIGGIPCVVVICADGGHAGLAAKLRANGVRYRLCPTAGGDNIDGVKEAPMSPEELTTLSGRQRYERLRGKVFDASHIQTLPADHVCGFASANALGDDGNGTHHFGHCMITGNDGVMLAQIPGNPVSAFKFDQMAHAVVSFS
jgi:predicted amidohydrolase